MSLFDARLTDPFPSHLAAERIAQGRETLVDTIRWWVAKQRQPVSAFEIGDAIAGLRWSHATVRTAIKRSGLTAVDTEGITPRNQRCTRYVLGERV